MDRAGAGKPAKTARTATRSTSSGQRSPQPEQPSRLTRLRQRHRWLDHLLRAGQRYTANHGDHYAAAVTYFSVLALVPLLMISFAVAGFVLVGQPELIDELKQRIAEEAPGGLGGTLSRVVDQAVESRTAVGLIGLVGAAYSGLGWMSHLRQALTAQWEQPQRKPSFLRAKLTDMVALGGLGLAILVSFGITAAGSAFATELLELVGMADDWWARALVVVLTLVLSLFGTWLVFLWVIARLPYTPVSLRSAVRAALLVAVGFEVFKQVGAIYLGSLRGSPAGLAFGPVLGLLVFAFLVSRFLLFATAWAATAREHEQPAPEPVAVIQPQVTVRGGPDGRTAAGLVGAGAVLGFGLTRLLRRH